jgi:hypothetical protein
MLYSKDNSFKCIESAGEIKMILQINKGILLYGYTENDAHFLKEKISETISDQILLKSASNLEEKTVKEILNQHTGFSYRQNQPNIILFFGMDDTDIQCILSDFPSSIERPIFCGLTEHNVNWKFEELIDHLLAEQEMMEKNY